MGASPEVIVIGGGIWGVSTAFHLALAGCRVRLVERNFDVAQETTINAAGQIGQIRPSPVVTRGIAYALDLFESFPSRFGHDPGLHRCGSLFIGLTPERVHYFKRQIDQGRANGLRVDDVDRAEMQRLVPGLRVDRIIGAYFVHGDGYLDSAKATRAMAAAAVDLGADLRMGVQAHALTMEHGRVTGVDTSIGHMAAGAVVVTAGPWTKAFLQQARVAVPAQPIRHQRVRTVPLPGLTPHHPVLRIPDFSSYVRPEQGSLIYGHFEREPVPYDSTAITPDMHTSNIEPPMGILNRARELLSGVYPALEDLEVAEFRRGLITFAPDGAYVVGPAPELTNVYFATGCAALGIAGSAAIGRWISEWIIHGEPDEDLTEFSPTRFGDIDDDRLCREASAAYANYYSIRST